MEMAYRERWRAEIEALRAILADLPLTEECKWGKPCFTRDGKNIVILQALTRFLRAWFDEHAFAAAGTRDFERELAAAWGAEATPFVADWVYGPGHPECVVSLQLVDGGVDVSVEQTQRTGPVGGFRFPLDVELVSGDARQRLTVDVTGRRATAHARVPFVPKEVLLDPDVTLYAHTDCRAAIPCH
ncbi:MAG: hypothetical protein JWM53_5957 [bacterium]|nr:hypothetical protein [bacterium]